MANITQITLDLTIFSLQAVKRAIHDANISQHATISASDDKIVTIQIDLDDVNMGKQKLEQILTQLSGFAEKLRVLFLTIPNVFSATSIAT